MADQTIGQRIAQERKKKELSQVGLATILDVSRQAISKWESDAAIPEIDKLIALSRLFDVSIGWLLGVEELPERQEQELTEKQHADLTESQWKTVETYIQKYQQPPKPHLTAFHYIFAIGASLLIFLLLYSQTSRIEKLLTTQAAQIEALTDRVTVIESKNTGLNIGSLLASYTLTPTVPDFPEFPGVGHGTSTLTLRAIPHVWNEGDEAWLHVQSTAGEFWEVPCQWDGSALSAAAQLAVDDGYEYAFVVTHPDGSRETQLLPEETAENLRTTFHIPGVHEIGTMEYQDGTLILRDYASTLTMPELYQQERFDEPGYYADPHPAAWQKVEYVLLVNDSASGAAYYRLPVVDQAEGLYPEDPVAYTLTAANPELRFENLQLSETTTHAQLWLYAWLDNGLQERYILNMFEYSAENGFSELP